jgi:hypothetical protein
MFLHFGSMRKFLDTAENYAEIEEKKLAGIEEC